MPAYSQEVELRLYKFWVTLKLKKIYKITIKQILNSQKEKNKNEYLTFLCQFADVAIKIYE